MRLGAFGFSFSHYEIPPFLTTCLRRGFGRQAEHTEDTERFINHEKHEIHESAFSEIFCNAVFGTCETY
jgi:hypothetical protein